MLYKLTLYRMFPKEILFFKGVIEEVKIKVLQKIIQELFREA